MRTASSHIARSCEVKAHIRSLPVRRSPLANAIHRALIKETGFKFRVKAGRRVR